MSTRKVYENARQQGRKDYRAGRLSDQNPMRSPGSRKAWANAWNEERLIADYDKLERVKGECLGVCAACGTPIYANGSICCAGTRMA